MEEKYKLFQENDRNVMNPAVSSLISPKTCPIGKKNENFPKKMK